MMGTLLRIVFILVGVLLIFVVMKTMKKKKMSAAQSLAWLFTGVVMILLGDFPEISVWFAGLFDVQWAPAMLIFLAIVIIAFICFNHAKEISVLRAQITELTEQVSVMKFELQDKSVLNKGTRED